MDLPERDQNVDRVATHGADVHGLPMSDDEAQLRIQLSEARTDTKFAQLIGEMRAGFAAVNGRFNAADARLNIVERSTIGLKATVIGTGVAVVAVLIGILAQGQTWFGIGVSMRDVIRATVAEYAAQHAPASTPLQRP